MTFKSISLIPNITPMHVSLFNGIRIKRTERLLIEAADVKGRESLAFRTSIDPVDILAYANACDLMRIRGIGTKHVVLLRRAGVPTVRTLRTRNPSSLHFDIVRANADNFAEFPPARRFVQSWIESAQKLNTIITY